MCCFTNWLAQKDTFSAFSKKKLRVLFFCPMVGSQNSRWGGPFFCYIPTVDPPSVDVSYYKDDLLKISVAHGSITFAFPRCLINLLR